MEIITLKQQHAAFKVQHPKMRIRDIAAALHVSEAELLMANLDENTILLENDPEAILMEVPSLGYVMALTRNEYCVHERKGVYKNISFSTQAGLVIGEDIDLRLFINQWKIIFAVIEGGHKSIQFFDSYGVAVHKIYLTDKSNTDNYYNLIKRFRKPDQREVDVLPTKLNSQTAKPDNQIKIAEFQQAWQTMQDTHEFFGILKRFSLTRTQALRLAPRGFSKLTTITEFKKIMQSCSETQMPVMVFVGNTGCIQIHTGAINRLVQMESWFNVLDPEFNLHLCEDAVKSVWHVVKPSADGDVNSIELFDENGEMIMQMFGKRKPGQPELTEWRQILAKHLAS